MDAAQIQGLLDESAKVIRSLQADKIKLASAVADYQRHELAEEIVALMDARGVGDATVPHKQKVAQVLASKKDLHVVKEAVRLSNTDMSFAKVSDEPGPGNRSSFVEYLLS